MVREQADEVGRRRLEGDLEGVRVHRLHPEPVQLLDLALGDLLAVGDGPEDEGVAGTHRRVHPPPQREDEIVSRHRIAVGPLGVLPETERVHLAVVAQGPALRHPRHHASRPRLPPPAPRTGRAGYWPRGLPTICARPGFPAPRRCPAGECCWPRGRRKRRTTAPPRARRSTLRCECSGAMPCRRFEHVPKPPKKVWMGTCDRVTERLTQRPSVVYWSSFQVPVELFPTTRSS